MCWTESNAASHSWYFGVFSALIHCVTLNVSVRAPRSIQESQCGRTTSTARRLYILVSASSSLCFWCTRNIAFFLICVTSDLSGSQSMSVLNRMEYLRIYFSHHMEKLILLHTCQDDGRFVRDCTVGTYTRIDICLCTLYRILMPSLVMYRDQMGDPYSTIDLSTPV